MKRSKPTISIIVPCYNAEQSMQRCLNSIFAQKYSDYELIVVNDGSTDGSERILKRCKDARLKIITTKNCGVSSARNTGIAKARGEWIFFIDSDDELRAGCLATLMKYAKSDVDIVSTRFMTVVHGERRPSPYGGKPTEYITTREQKAEFCRSIFTDMPKRFRYPHAAIANNKLFRASLIRGNEIEFDKALKVYEDALFVMRTTHAARKIVYNNRLTYTYYISDNSTTKRIGDDVIQRYKNVYNKLFKGKELAYLRGNLDEMKIKDLNLILHYSCESGAGADFVKIIAENPLFSGAIKNINIRHISKLKRVVVILLRLHLYKLVPTAYRRAK